MFKINKNNQIENENKIIKTLEPEEIEPAEYILNVFKSYDLNPEDINIHQDNFFKELPELKNIISILLVGDYYTAESVFSCNLKELLENIQDAPNIFDMSMNDFIDKQEEILNIPENMSRYFDYSSLINDMETGGELNGYTIKDKKTNEVLARFIIEYYELESFFNDIGL